MRFAMLPLLVLLTSCGALKNKLKPIEDPATLKDDLPAAEDLSDYYALNASIMMRMPAFYEDGQVVSRRWDFSADNVGDSKLFTGIALGSLPCDQGEPVLDAIISSINKHDGAIIRYEDLTGYEDNQTSIDAVTGVMFGLTERARKCPQDADRIKAAWQKHRDFVFANNGKLAPVVKDYGLVDSPGFRYGWDLAGHILGTNDKPKDSDAAATELEVISMVAGVRHAKTNCYNVHLALLTMLMAARGGHPVARVTRYTVCEEVSGLSIPLADWYCEFQPASVYLQGFHLNEWEYRHQRCGAWDQPDGNGEFHPGVDALIMFEMARQH